MGNKKRLTIDHAIALQNYLDKFNFPLTGDYVTRFYNEVFHLIPAKIYDTDGHDYKAMLENKCYILALDKTEVGFTECKVVIEAILDAVISDIIKIDGAVNMIHVYHSTENKIFIELEDIGEHNGG